MLHRRAVSTEEMKTKKKQFDRRGRNQFWLRDSDRLLLQVTQTPRSLKGIRSLTAERRAVSVPKKTRLLAPQNASVQKVFLTPSDAEPHDSACNGYGLQETVFSLLISTLQLITRVQGS